MRVAVSEVLSATGLSRAIGLKYRGSGVIFMLHSVVDDPADYFNQPVRCSRETLERALWWVRDNKLDVVDLDGAVERLRTPGSKPFVVFTFDDGYRDNIEVALPVFERYDLPMTIFVTTSMVTRQMFGWWMALVPLLKGIDTLDFEGMDRKFDVSTVALKQRAIGEIGRWVHADGARAELLRPTFAKYGIDVEGVVDQEAMSEDDVRAAGRHHLVTLGGHTTSHCFLNLQTPEVVRDEIADNKRFLENLIGDEIRDFAYPYGAAGQREAEIVRDLGFSTAVTTRSGTVFPEHGEGDKVFTMPREALDQHDTPACLDCRFQGVYRFLRSRGGRPVATL